MERVLAPLLRAQPLRLPNRPAQGDAKAVNDHQHRGQKGIASEQKIVAHDALGLIF